MELNEIISKYIGEPYEMYNEDGTYRGCFRPVQLLYPEKPRYKLRSKNDDKNFFYGIAKIRKHCTLIDRKDLKIGDIIATRFRDELHVGIFTGYGKILHVFRGHTMQIGKLSLFKEYQCFRVN